MTYKMSTQQGDALSPPASTSVSLQSVQFHLHNSSVRKMRQSPFFNRGTPSQKQRGEIEKDFFEEPGLKTEISKDSVPYRLLPLSKKQQKIQISNLLT